ncbi:serine hydrolase domain-containing protein [Metabacillus mangrovi]|uniref:serine hydrolase domain-containing protein n=1 Tax=Metabacillus mangrovi TaxID=1491830 RepID=UPI0012BA5ABA|nr:serine hydrolase domain-containing protein [Metabacillus mangrovi]
MKSFEYHNQKVYKETGAAALSCLILQGDKVVYESYTGTHSRNSGAGKVQENSRFNIASIRKSYIGLALACMIAEGKIRGLDQDLSDFYPDVPLINGTTFRHVLTHTHGLAEKDGKWIRMFQPGEDWSYNNAGVNLLISILETVSGKTVAQILDEQVFRKAGFAESGWGYSGENAVSNLLENPSQRMNGSGKDSNLYCSTRDLAKWGKLFLTEGKEAGILTPDLFKQMTSVQNKGIAPLPQHGFFWWMKEKDFPQNEIGPKVPKGSFQLLGITGCICLVMPEYHAVAVRMMNQSGQNKAFDYLDDVRTFGDLAAGMVKNP